MNFNKSFLLISLLLSINIFAQGFDVKNYEVEIFISEKGYFDVVEKYKVDFFQAKHGIIRKIQTRYDFLDKNQVKENRRIYISNIKVPNHKFSKTSDWQLRYQDFLDLKIGNKNRLVTGEQYYEIRYRVENAFIHEAKTDQFYWNIKPPYWNAIFENVNFKIHLPDNVALDSEQVFIYAGAFGNDVPTDDFIIEFSDQTITAKSKSGVQFKYNESVTALIKMPPNSIAQLDFTPNLFQKYGWIAILILPVYFFIEFWKKHGKNKKTIAITSYYPPDGIDSAIAGYLINDKADANDLISLLPKWGNKGLIRIEELEEKNWFSKPDTKIIQLKPLPKTAAPYEKTIFNGLFEIERFSSIDLMKTFKSVKSIFTASTSQDEIENPEETGDNAIKEVLVSQLQKKFYTQMDKAKRQLVKESRKYYERDSNQKMKISSLIIFVVGIIFSWLMFVFFGILAAIISGLVFLAMFLIGINSKKRNEEGSRVYSELKGFRQFVKLAETNRIKALIKSDPDYFEKTMSYALTFGLLKQWAKKFEALDIQPPEWYSSPHITGPLTINSFANSLNDNLNNVRSNMVSTPSSSGGGSSGSRGGGSSGGGFGGGGGGSW